MPRPRVVPGLPGALICAPFRRQSPAWVALCPQRLPAIPLLLLLALHLLLPLLGLAQLGAGAARAEKLIVLGESARNGIFDPSVAVDPASGEAWLAYSAVSGSAVPWGPNVETHLARSVDGGATYSFVAAANVSEPAAIMIGGMPTSGFFNHEVPSLAYDATDPGGEWKLLTHRLFRRATSPFPFGADLNEPAYSWLELWEAPAPTGPWSRVVRLGAGPTPLPPFGVDLSLNGLDPQLASVAVYTEPGLFVESGALYLSLSGISGIAPHRSRIVLLRSNDHGASWSFVGPLLGSDEAAALGFVDFDGSAIVRQQGRSFLFASSGTASVPRDGLAVFEFSSLANGALYGQPGQTGQLGSPGVPALLDHIPVDPAAGGVPFGGQGHFHEGAPAGGILMNQLETTAYPVLFAIERTGRTPVPEPVVGAGLLIGVLAWVARGRAPKARETVPRQAPLRAPT